MKELEDAAAEPVATPTVAGPAAPRLPGALVLGVPAGARSGVVRQTAILRMQPAGDATAVTRRVVVGG